MGPGERIAIMLSAERNDYLTRVGPGTAMGSLLRRYWIPLLHSQELDERDGGPLRIRLLGESLVAFRDGSGRVGLLDHHCPPASVAVLWPQRAGRPALPLPWLAI